MYAKVLLTSSSKPETRWVSLGDFFLCAFTNMKDAKPTLLIHISNITFTEAFDEIGQLHSIRVNISGPCSFNHLFIYTPNQFDIADLKKELEEERKKWNNFYQKENPDTSKKYTLDHTGKFIFRPVDRIYFEVVDKQIKISQMNQEEIYININKDFYIHPINDSSKDVQWIEIKYKNNSEEITKQYHCSSYDEMKQLVNVALQIKYQS